MLYISYRGNEPDDILKRFGYKLCSTGLLYILTACNVSLPGYLNVYL